MARSYCNVPLFPRGAGEDDSVGEGEKEDEREGEGELSTVRLAQE